MYLNPIIEEVNPTSTAGLMAIVEWCNLPHMRVELDPPHAEYGRGWGPNESDSRPIIAS